ncbi:hypothetical protein SAY86_019326 [Trapa natans]|uniref:Secreted protein n=1 Tax=Trapa natans TaxID=22666 RepID=A0AAN7LJM0_TRANT|nr:hypothetical protein SAY86_019326 [Trapa natans]
MTRDCDGALLVKSVLLLGLLEQLQEARVVDMGHRNHEPFLILALSHQYRQAPFRDALIRLVMVNVEVGKMEVEDGVDVVLLGSHRFFSSKKIVYVHLSDG